MSHSFIDRSSNYFTQNYDNEETQKKIDPIAQLKEINNTTVREWGLFNNHPAQMFAKEEEENQTAIQAKKLYSSRIEVNDRQNGKINNSADNTIQMNPAGLGKENEHGQIPTATGGSLEGGIKLTYSLNGGFSISLYGGLSKKLSEFGMIGANASLIFIRGGAGTSKSSPNLLEFTISPSLTLGYKDAPEIPLNLYIDQSGTGVMNPFQNSFTMGGTLILSSGINSDGSHRHQWIGGAGLRIGGAFALNSYNDTKRFPFFGQGSDQFRSAGLNGSLQIGDNKLEWANDMYYGMSNNEAKYKDDIVIGDHHYDDQNIYDLLLNNGRERLSFMNSKLGINETKIRSGAETFWPSNKMHDSMRILNPDDGKEYPFHRLFVPYPNTQEQLIKYLEYKKMKEQENNNTEEK